MNLRTLTAADVMTEEVVRIKPGATLRAAVQTMNDQRVRSLMVDRESPHHGWGILTIRDVIGVVHDDGDRDDMLDELTVGEIATRPAIHVGPELGVPDCINLMRTTGVRRLPVVRGDDVIGVVSYTDVFHAIARSVTVPVS